MKLQKSTGPRLGELLETRGKLQREALLKALRHQRGAGGRIGTALVELELIEEDDLLHVLSDQFRVPFAAPEVLRTVAEDVIRLVPEKVARTRFAIPIRASSTHLTIAMRDPNDLVAIDELAFVTGRRIRPQVGSEVRILEALSRYYSVDIAGRFVKLLDRLNRARFLWASRSDQEAAAPDAAPTTLDLPNLRTLPAGPSPSPYDTPDAGRLVRLPQPLRPIPSPPAPAVQTADPLPAPLLIPVVAPNPPPQMPRSPAPPTASAGELPIVAPAAVDTPLPGAARLLPSPMLISIADAQTRLLQVADRDAIGALVLDFARGRADSALLLGVRRDEATGWMGFGAGLDDESVAACRVDLKLPSFLRELRDGVKSHRGDLDALPAHAEIRSLLATNSAADLHALPLKVRGRLVGVLTMTREESAFSAATLEEFSQVVAKASVALELVILRQKLKQA